MLRRVLLSAAVLLVAACAPAPGDVPAPAATGADIASAIASVPTTDFDELGVSVWIGPADLARSDGAPLHAEAPDVPRPAASSIKTAYLVELFAAREAALDEPLPDAVAIVGDPGHPAVAHFDAETQAGIEAALADATTRTVGFHMIRGTEVSNAVYNAAANLTTAFLGGPEGLTARIHARHPGFGGIHSRRYMLAARDVTGDNTATAASLAAVLAAVARGDTPGVPASLHQAIRDVVFLEDTDHGVHHFKGGSLNSDPLTRVLSGYHQPAGASPGEALVYVFMVEIPGPDRIAPGDLDRAAAGERLADLVGAMRDAALPPARRVLAEVSP